MTNGDRMRNCSNECLACVYKNLQENAIYSEYENRRLLNSEDSDFLIWLNKESEDIDDCIFEMRYKKVSLCVFINDDYDTVEVRIPFYKDEEYIKSLFLEVLGVEYNSDYCTYVFWS